jgi:hypothetical protein
MGGGLYDHLMSMRIFTLIINEMFIQALEFTKKVSMTLIWLC